MATISLVITAWNARDRLARCLAAVALQTRPPDEVLVVDNGSTDGTAAWLAASHPGVILVSLPANRGSGGGANAGIRRARGDWIALLDSDAYPTPTWLQALERALQARPAFAFAASRLLQAANPGLIDAAGDGFDPVHGPVMIGCGQPNGPAFDQLREVFSTTHAAALYRRDVFDRTGEMDESFFAYDTDVDFGFRARLLGFRCLYVPDAVAHHERSVTVGHNSPRQIRLIYRNGMAAYLKNMPGPLLRRYGRRALRNYLGALRHAPHRRAALRGTLEALWRLPATLHERRRIQRARTVDLARLESAMTTTGTPLPGDDHAGP